MDRVKSTLNDCAVYKNNILFKEAHNGFQHFPGLQL